ncbi:helix-turn-helix domain-containing protein [Candidatus Enterococcus clewellii]|uniref:HTH cro/C1-type domain-containing protein n=1 Tax=Candidatus Enterococcus clewellii TaxID=1834193 RepID=A0A242K937_9ENTE|nr:Rgg/GadR/MutR family transcriptional regulator [Enterococcus sp. 9E7_DIV0242]OTP17662.1 hypothetical protein A5888_001800 [Enterococcus sp. 9E7_DIV0242]
MEIGETLRYLRENKHYTKKAVADGIVSISFYSQVEQGNSSITIELFFKLLKKLNVTFDEFFLIANDFTPSEEDRLWNNFISAYYEEDLGKMIKERNNIQQAIDNSFSENPVFETYLLTADLAINRTKYEQPQQKDIDKLFHILFSVDTWTLFELKLFINTIHFFDVDLIMLLSSKMLDYSNKYHTKTEHISMYNSALINLIGALLKHRLMDEAAYFITILRRQSASHKDLYERNMLLYLDGIRLLILEATEKGTRKVSKSIEIFDTLGMSGRATRYRNEIRDFFGIEIPTFDRVDL